jgi:hypothetical protein
MPSSQRGTPTDCAQSCMGHCVQYRTRTLNGRARVALPISPFRWQCSTALGAMGAILPVTARPHNPLLVARRKAREAAESSGLLNLSCYRIRETHVWRPAAYQNFTERFLASHEPGRTPPPARGPECRFGPLESCCHTLFASLTPKLVLPRGRGLKRGESSCSS